MQQLEQISEANFETAPKPVSNLKGTRPQSAIKRGVSFAQNEQVAPVSQKSAEVERLERKIAQLEEQNQQLHIKMRADNIEEIYKENDMLRMESRNMEILMEENKDLKRDILLQS